MKLKTKIVLMTSAWLVFLLIVVDLAVYFLFLHTTTRTEVDSLRKSANQLVEKYGVQSLIGVNPVEIPETELPDNTYFRVVTPDSRVSLEFSNAAPFKLPAPSFSSTQDWRIDHLDADRILTIHVPLREGNFVNGTLEVSENLEQLEANTQLLIAILVSTAVGAVILCALGGSLLFRSVILPVTRMIRTMEHIETSLSLSKIPVTGKVKDELSTMTHTFNRMVVRLEESHAKMRQFVSDASHELGTTLTIIEGYANMLRRWGIQDPAALRESVESIHEEAKRMRGLTDQLTALAALEDGTGLTRSDFDLVQLCRNTMKRAAKLGIRNITLSEKPDVIPVRADPAKISQLLLILLDNALKYSRERIEITLRENVYGAVVIEVRDYGIGIPPESLERVFDRFYRVDEARTRDTGGTGLGLAIAKTIAGEHGGSIRAESEWGSGTVMHVELPILQERNPGHNGENRI